MKVSSEAIARVIADLRTGRIKDLPMPADVTRANQEATRQLARGQARRPGPVVDATPLYESLMRHNRPVHLYEDHPCIAPPWPDAAVGYVNEHGNVRAMTMHAMDMEPDIRHIPWETAEAVDTSRVRWLLNAWLWVGGRSKGEPMPTAGPAFLWQFAIYEDGEPADLHWVNIAPGFGDRHDWTNPHLTVLAALNFLNCRNIELVEPKRTRSLARRIARTGVTVQTINVFPVSRSTPTHAANRTGQGTPLHSVRGHFATYGPQYGKGLMFGRIAGRFFIPQHARGSADHGEIQSDYRLRPDTTEDTP